MPFQNAADSLAHIKREVTFNTLPGTSSAHTLRALDSPGLKATYNTIASGERRDDGWKPVARAGARSVGGTFNLELTVGGAIDMLLESAMRSVWSSALAITEATGSAGAIVIAASGSNFTITRTGGSWITDGIRVGDVGRLTNHATAGNNNINLRVVTLTATVMTVAAPAGSGFAAAASDAAWTFTRLKKLAGATTPTNYSHTIEQNYQTIDGTEVFTGCRLTGLTVTFNPGSPVTFSATFMGADHQVLEGVSAPYFVSPSITTGDTLIVEDASLRFNGADVATFSGFQLTWAIAASTLAVIGARTTPDIFMNDAEITGSITGPRSDLSNITRLSAETEFEMSILLQEPEAAPKDCIHFFLPRVKVMDVDAAFSSGDGPQSETLALSINPKTATSGYDAGPITISSSGA